MLRGNQAPRLLHRPPFTTEASGLEAIELMDVAGMPLFPWQALSVRVALAEREDGLWAAREFGELVARQQGKGGVLESICLHGMVLMKLRLQLWTSHQFKTSSESFLRMKALFDNSDWLRKRVWKIDESHGEEGIKLYGPPGRELTEPVRLRFLARSKSSGRGFSPQRVFWDESQELSPWAHRAMKNSTRAQVNPQHIYTGTVPDELVSYPEHWTRMRDRGRSKSGRRFAWMEFTPEGSDVPETAAKLDIYDREHWRAAAPSMGYLEGSTEEAMLEDIEESDDAGVRIEILSIWPTLDPDGGGSVLDTAAWKKSARPKAKMPEGPVVLYVDVRPDGKRGYIGLAAEGRSKNKVLLLVRRFDDVDAIVPYLKKQLEKRDVHAVRLHPQSQAGALIPDLVDAGVDYEPMNSTELGQACAKFIRGVRKRRYLHVDQAELNDAVKAADIKVVGEAKRWVRGEGDDVDLSPLYAASGAAYAYAQVDTSGFSIF